MWRGGLAAAALLAAMAGTACGEPPLGDDCGSEEWPEYQYALDRILLPTTLSDAEALGLNLDSDEQGRPDNALGAVLTALAGEVPELVFQDESDTQLVRGQTIMLAQAKIPQLPTAVKVTFWLFPGTNPSVLPCDGADDEACGNHLDGSARFDVDAGDPHSFLTVGQVVDGALVAGPGAVRIQLPLLRDAPPLVLDLYGAWVQIDRVTAGRLVGGVVGGAIRASDLAAVVLPDLAASMNTVIESDCTALPTEDPPCGCGDTVAARLVDIFDTDAYPCEISADEIRESDLVGRLLAPDVDLFQGDGQFSPRTDGIDDALSLGIGFSAVGAEFSIPPSPLSCP